MKAGRDRDISIIRAALARAAHQRISSTRCHLANYALQGIEDRLGPSAGGPLDLLGLCRDHPQVFLKASLALAEEVREYFSRWIADGDHHAIEWVVENTVVAYAIRVHVAHVTGSSPVTPWPLVELEALARFFALLRLVGRG